MSTELPKIIWTAWFQGIENAPSIVKICHNSWLKENPDWKVILIDDQNIRDFFDLESIIGKNRDDIGIQQKSDILRLNLLAQHGGIWADATCFCSAPLDTWIDRYLKSGFFVFRQSEKDRILSNWFIMSEKDCHLTKAFCKEYNRYWSENIFSNQNTEAGKYLTKNLPWLSRKTGYGTDFLVSKFAQKRLKIYPYFAFHYYFSCHLRNDFISKKIFSEIPYASSDNSFRLARLARKDTNIQEIRKAVLEVMPPVHKLTWKEIFFRGEGLNEIEYLTAVFE